MVASYCETPYRTALSPAPAPARHRHRAMLVPPSPITLTVTLLQRMSPREELAVGYNPGTMKSNFHVPILHYIMYIRSGHNIT